MNDRKPLVFFVSHGRERPDSLSAGRQPCDWSRRVTADWFVLGSCLEIWLPPRPGPSGFRFPSPGSRGQTSVETPPRGGPSFVARGKTPPCWKRWPTICSCRKPKPPDACQTRSINGTPSDPGTHARQIAHVVVHCPTRPPMTETHTFLIRLRIPDAVEPDEYAIRAYDDDRLQDMTLAGPDEDEAFDAEFDREDDSFSGAVRSAMEDLTAVFPEAEILSVDAEHLADLSVLHSQHRAAVDAAHEARTPSDHGSLQGRGRNDQSWPVQGDPRWRISKWPDGSCFIEGPEILPADDSLTGVDWFHAATVEVQAVTPRLDGYHDRRVKRRMEDLVYRAVFVRPVTSCSTPRARSGWWHERGNARPPSKRLQLRCSRGSWDQIAEAEARITLAFDSGITEDEALLLRDHPATLSSAADEPGTFAYKIVRILGKLRAAFQPPEASAKPTLLYQTTAPTYSEYAI